MIIGLVLIIANCYSRTRNGRVVKTLILRNEANKSFVFSLVIAKRLPEKRGGLPKPGPTIRFFLSGCRNTAEYVCAKRSSAVSVASRSQQESVGLFFLGH